MWARAAYGTAPWGAEVVPNVLPPGWQDIPPPIPAATTNFTYLAQPGVGPWAGRSWAGAQATPVFPGGGISIAPDSDRGVMQIFAWWPDSPTLQVMRIGQDGTRTPVRGGYGFPVSGSTRRNLCPNPSFEAGLNGYVQIAGTTTLTQVTTAGYVVHGTSAMRMTSSITSTGAQIPGTFPGAGPYTVAFSFGSSTTPTAVTLTIAWLDVLGASAGSTALSLSTNQINASVGQLARHVFNFSAPGNAVSGTASITITGIVAGSTATYLDALVFERGTTDGAYFDGGSSGAQWAGVQHLSVAIQSPIQSLLDGECPLDVPVTYEVYGVSTVGGRMRSTPAVLESRDTTWITHPATPTVPQRVKVAKAPNLEHALQQAVFGILDSPFPVVISAAVRMAPSGTLTFLTESWAERDQLLEGTFADGTPVLLRAPNRFGYDEGMWIVVGTITEDTLGLKAFDPDRDLIAPFQEVEAPADLLVA